MVRRSRRNTLNAELVEYKFSEQKTRMDKVDASLDTMGKQQTEQLLMLQQIKDGIGNKEKGTGLAYAVAAVDKRITTEMGAMNERVKRVENFHGTIRMVGAIVAGLVAIGAGVYAWVHGAKTT